MTKEVLLSIKGLQVSEDSQKDTVEVIAPGEYFNRNNKHYLLYDEVVEGQVEEPVKNVIKIGTDILEVTKKGPLSVHMVFEKNKKNITYYTTPFGSLLIGIEASNIEVEESEEEIRASVDYKLDMNYEFVANSHIEIIVKPKGTKNFKIMQ